MADSNVDSDHAFAWGANIGWVNWHANGVNGAEVGEFICSGFIYSANAGWIHLGDGTPENGLRYQNNSATDYGVNHDQFGNLRGLAYGANIGWVQFEDIGAPRVDLETGKLNGSVYGANIGWINLEAAELMIRALAPGRDTDNDTIPDAWEIAWSGNLEVLAADADADQDGVSDRDEYLADTDPLNASDQLRIVEFSRVGESWRLSWPSKLTRRYVIQTRADLDEGGGRGGRSPEVQNGTGSLLTRMLNIDPPAPHLFFRIEALRPLVDLGQNRY